MENACARETKIRIGTETTSACTSYSKTLEIEGVDSFILNSNKKLELSVNIALLHNIVS